jgi:O-antigen/teichoic acid export membrane protein
MNIKRFGKAGIFLGANIVSAGIPFLLLPFLTKALTPSDYGIVAMFGVMVNVFGTLTGLSVHGAIGVRYFELPNSIDQHDNHLRYSRFVWRMACWNYKSAL